MSEHSHVQYTYSHHLHPSVIGQTVSNQVQDMEDMCVKCVLNVCSWPLYVLVDHGNITTSIHFILLFFLLAVESLELLNVSIKIISTFSRFHFQFPQS